MVSLYDNSSTELISMEISGIKHSSDQRLSPDVPFPRTFSQTYSPYYHTTSRSQLSVNVQVSDICFLPSSYMVFWVHETVVIDQWRYLLWLLDIIPPSNPEHYVSFEQPRTKTRNLDIGNLSDGLVRALKLAEVLEKPFLTAYKSSRFI